MRFHDEFIDISEINIKDTTYKITTESSVNDLVKSIKDTGLINLPIIIKKNKKYIVICGFRRIAACKKIGLKDINVRIADSSLDQLSCLKYSITENNCQRPLNLIEQANALFKLNQLLQEHPDRLNIISNLISLPKNPNYLKNFEKIASLPLKIQDLILNDTIPFSIALLLSDADEKSAVIFSKIFNELKPTLNIQREMIITATEIGFIDEIKITDLFKEKNIKKILENQDIVRNEKINKIRSYLKQRRFPKLTEALHNYEKNVAELDLNNNTKLIPPKNFEGSDYTISCIFKTLEDLNAFGNSIKELLQKPSLKTILK